MINLLECLSIKFKKNNKSCSFSKAARMSSIKFAFVKDYTHLSMYICKTHENISKDRSQETTHGCSINFIIKFTVKKKMSLWCSKKEKFFKFFFSDVYIGIMIENEIYCYINGFVKRNISKKTSYIAGNKKFTGKICILNLRSKEKGSS